MEERLKQFWEKGYVLIPGVISPDVVVKLLLKVKRLRYDSVGERVAGDPCANYRTQSPFPIASKDFMDVKVQARRRVLKDADMRWEAVHWVVRKSLPGSDAQEPHKDFPSSEIARARDKYSTIQAGIKIGLMPNTKLIVYDSCFAEANPLKQKTIVYGAGDAVLFRGDLVHAEASSDALNYHIRATLTVKGIDWGEKESEVVPAPTFKCKYCPFLATTSRKIHNHNRFCPYNPAKSDIVARYKALDEMGKTCAICNQHFAKANTYYQHKARKHRQEKSLN